MLIFKSFYRKKTTKNFLIIFILLYTIMGTLFFLRQYYIKETNKTYSNAYIYVEDTNNCQRLYHYKNITDIQEALTLEIANQEYFFKIDKQLSDNEIILPSLLPTDNSQTTIDLTYEQYSHNFQVKGLQENGTYSSFYSVNANNFALLKNQKEVKSICAFSLNNWLNKDKTLAKLDKQYDQIYTFNYKSANLDFTNINKVLSIFLNIFIYIFLAILLTSIINIIFSEKTKNTLYTAIGFTQSQVLGYLFLKILSLHILAIPLGYCFAKIIYLLLI